MPVRIDPSEQCECVLEQDQALPSEQQTRWQYTPMTASQARTLRKKHTDRKSGRVDEVGFSIDVCKLKCSGWSNYLNADGTEFPYDKNEFEKMPVTWVTELAANIVGSNEAEDEDLKN